VGLPSGQQERQRIAKRIDHGMDFGAQPDEEANTSRRGEAATT
jgi:hypothetical protein